MFHKLIRHLALAAVMVAAIATAATRAGDYPQDTIRLVVAWKAGGGTDTIARAFAKAMGEFSKQAVIVENLTGGLGNRAHLHVKDSKPDGLTMMFNGSSDFTSVSVLNDIPVIIEDA